jgi:hypothetical protein
MKLTDPDWIRRRSHSLVPAYSWPHPDRVDESAARGYASVATYWMGEGLVTSLFLLLVIPLCTVLFGTFGAIIGQLRRPAQTH